MAECGLGEFSQLCDKLLDRHLPRQNLCTHVSPLPSISPLRFQKHAIAVGIKSVFLLNRVAISGQHPLRACKSTHQHQQRRLWQMEVGKQCADNPKFVSRIDKDAGFSRSRTHSSRVACRMLKGAHGGGADGHYPPPRIERMVDLVGSFRRDDVRLVVQFVIFHTLDTDRLKSSQAHMKSDLGGFDSTLANAVKNLRSEVQASGRSCNRTAFLRVNGLIALPVFKTVLAIDVRGQRHVPKSFNSREEIFGGAEADSPLTKLVAFYNFPLKLRCIAKEQ